MGILESEVQRSPQLNHPFIGLNMSANNINPKKVALLKTIRSLINCLVNIKDETGQFLLTLEDGRIIDTKGWNDWEVMLEYFLPARPLTHIRLVDTWCR